MVLGTEVGGWSKDSGDFCDEKCVGALRSERVSMAGPPFEVGEVDRVMR